MSGVPPSALEEGLPASTDRLLTASLIAASSHPKFASMLFLSCRLSLSVLSSRLLWLTDMTVTSGASGKTL